MINFMLLDTETTGLKGHCIQLAFKHYEESRLLKELNAMFKPPVPIEPDAERVHGISMAQLEDKPFIGSLNPEFQLALNKTIVVAHNAEFDVSILERDGFRVPWSICTQKVAKYFLPHLQKHKLQTLRQDLNLEVDEHTTGAKAHDAMGDVLILEQLFFRLLELAQNQWETATPKQIFANLVDISRKPKW